MVQIGQFSEKKQISCLRLVSDFQWQAGKTDVLSKCDMGSMLNVNGNFCNICFSLHRATTSC